MPTSKYSIRQLALAYSQEFDPDDISESSYDDTIFEVGQGRYPSEYLVCTDQEADDKQDESLESYLDEFLDSSKEVPDSFKMYFDRDAWKRDAGYDGRGHNISSYDGNEHEVHINSDAFRAYVTTILKGQEELEFDDLGEVEFDGDLTLNQENYLFIYRIN